jgi:Stage II sporulation protein E (SpoIIE)
VGGDFFQLIEQEVGSAGLILGNVSGKDLKAAMTVSLIVDTVRTLVDVTNDPAEILAGLNRRLHGRLNNGFATCLVLRFDSEGDCVLSNAGHLGPRRESEAARRRHRHPDGLPEDAARPQNYNRGPRGHDCRAACELEESCGADKESVGVVSGAIWDGGASLDKPHGEVGALSHRRQRKIPHSRREEAKSRRVPKVMPG